MTETEETFEVLVYQQGKVGDFQSIIHNTVFIHSTCWVVLIFQSI